MRDERRLAWNARHKELRSLLTKPERHAEAIVLALKQHAMVHVTEVSASEEDTFCDELWEGLNEKCFRAVSPKGEGSIARKVYHMARIEDITMNILVADETQVLHSDNWLQRINSVIQDTGNALTEQEVAELSYSLDMEELGKYRIAVGKRTQQIIQTLTPADLQRKIEPARLQRILDEGAVLNVAAANWLIDFWGRRNVAGLLLMPATRHNLVHINESLRLKKKFLE